MCNIARLNGEEYKAFTKAHNNKVGRPGEGPPKSEPKGAKNMCLECLSEIAPGKPHWCVKTVKRDNLIDLVEKMSPQTKSNLLVHELKIHAEEQSKTSRGGQITLQSGSCQLPVTVGKARGEKMGVQFTHRDLIRLGSQLNSSNNELM